jgi:hypothetical protein
MTIQVKNPIKPYDILIHLIKYSIPLISGFYLEYSGIQMIFKQIESTSLISLQILQFQLTATDIGIAVIFLGVILQIITVRSDLNIIIN